MSLLLVILLFVIAFMIFVSAVLLVIGPVMLLQPYRRTAEYYRKHTSLLHPRDAGLPCEELTLKTSEGLSLSAWFIAADGEAKGTVMYLHGVSECKIVGIPAALRMHERGYNVFLYDSRRHGESEGTYCTYGFYEKRDASTAIDYLCERFGTAEGKIGLFGGSMGAAVALQVAANDHRVVAVAAESGFATLRTIMDDYQARMIKLPWHYLRNIVIKRSEVMAHFRANSVSPLEAVRDIHVPVFILHGTADTLIAPEYSEMIFRAANEPKQLWLISGARHDNMAEVGGEEYWRRILGFFEEHLRTEGSSTPSAR